MVLVQLSQETIFQNHTQIVLMPARLERGWNEHQRLQSGDGHVEVWEEEQMLYAAQTGRELVHVI